MKSSSWVKATGSVGNGACVEVLNDGKVVWVRDSKDRKQGLVFFDHDTWQAFLADVKAGKFDDE